MGRTRKGLCVAADSKAPPWGGPLAPEVEEEVILAGPRDPPLCSQPGLHHEHKDGGFSVELAAGPSCASSSGGVCPSLSTKVKGQISPRLYYTQAMQAALCTRLFSFSARISGWETVPGTLSQGGHRPCGLLPLAVPGNGPANSLPCPRAVPAFSPTNPWEMVAAPAGGAVECSLAGADSSPSTSKLSSWPHPLHLKHSFSSAQPNPPPAVPASNRDLLLSKRAPPGPEHPTPSDTTVSALCAVGFPGRLGRCPGCGCCTLCVPARLCALLPESKSRPGSPPGRPGLPEAKGLPLPLDPTSPPSQHQVPQTQACLCDPQAAPRGRGGEPHVLHCPPLPVLLPGWPEDLSPHRPWNPSSC